MKIHGDLVIPKYFRDGKAVYPEKYQDWFKWTFKSYYCVPNPIIISNNKVVTVGEFKAENKLKSSIRTITDLIVETEKTYKRDYSNYFKVIIGSNLRLEHLKFVFDDFLLNKDCSIYFCYDILRLLQIGKEKLVQVRGNKYQDELNDRARNIDDLFHIIDRDFDGLFPESIITETKDFGLVNLYGGEITATLVGTNFEVATNNAIRLEEDDRIWDFFDMI
ncbi:hypothetical protein [Nafulsella turpanensis]|uniref:hypothetical protein n=1 Tax=Nafulsella turpanensis TaxID=1265690 RepID=UPI00034BEEA0|nr:hypothetical protein [Nafulsella turpanensis]